MKKHRAVIMLSSIALALIAGGFAWAFFALGSVGASSLILHWNDVSGITGAGDRGAIVFAGVLGLLVAFMNSATALELDSRGAFFGKFLAAMTLVFAALLFIAFAAIVNVNV